MIMVWKPESGYWSQFFLNNECPRATRKRSSQATMSPAELRRASLHGLPGIITEYTTLRLRGGSGLQPQGIGRLIELDGAHLKKYP